MAYAFYSKVYSNNTSSVDLTVTFVHGTETLSTL